MKTLLKIKSIQLEEYSISIVSKEASPNTDISEPYFVFAINNIWLPWTVDDNINECYD